MDAKYVTALTAAGVAATVAKIMALAPEPAPTPALADKAPAGAKPKPKPVYVLDCGGQFCHLIASRIRNFECLSVIKPCETPAAELADAGAIIVSGGPQSVFDKASMRVDKELWNLPVPILGICYGVQMMCHDLGGEVQEATTGEYGKAQMEKVPTAHEAQNILRACAPTTQVWMSHRDRVTKIPPGFECTGKTADCEFAAVQCIGGGRRLFGLQLHPEVTHTSEGLVMLKTFVEAAGLLGTWKMDNFIDEQVAAIRAKVKEGDRNVFVLVSGGVDSTVTYSLLAKALPKERILGLYVDTGMMRKNETKLVQEALATANLPNLHYVNAEEQFLAALEGVTAPEAKRRIIGQQFLQIQKEQVKKLGLNADKWLLGQGTIYPDTIESGGANKKADVIKTHHNRVPEIDALIAKGLVIEPVMELYKDEVRAVGEKLKLPGPLVWRHPFPGPGLGVRLLCHDGVASTEGEVLARNQAVKEIGPSLPKGMLVSVPPLKSVGCQGDSRTYRNFAVLSGAYEQDWELLDTTATAIINGNPLVNRCVVSLVHNKAGTKKGPAYDITVGGPHTTTKPRLDRLREADAIVMEELARAELMSSIWQCPVAMAPLSLHGSKDEVIILRPVNSTEAMTAQFSRVPWGVCATISARIMAEVPGVCDVLYDVTNKPPGTIEWE